MNNLNVLLDTSHVILHTFFTLSGFFSTCSACIFMCDFYTWLISFDFIFQMWLILNLHTWFIFTWFFYTIHLFFQMIELFFEHTISIIDLSNQSIWEKWFEKKNYLFQKIWNFKHFFFNLKKDWNKKDFSNDLFIFM